MGRFDGEVILLTGAACGLGRAAAHLFYEEGATLALVDILAEEVEGLADELGARATAYPADLSSVSEIRRVVEAIVSTHDRIDVLINNAAICPRIPFPEVSEADWDRQFGVNAKSQFFLMKAVFPLMRAQGSGRIVNVISSSGQFGASVNASVYSGTKGAIIAFSKSIAREVAQYGITVNCFSPGTMMTSLIQNLPEKTQDAVRKSIPMGRFTTPEEMAVNLAFVASSDCGFATGATFDFIGGAYMR